MVFAGAERCCLEFSHDTGRMGRYRSWLFCTLIAALSLLTRVRADDEDEGAIVMVHKRVLTKDVVEGRNLTFAYEVYNLGTSTALTVSIDDQYGLANLDILEGDKLITFENLAPGARDRKTVTVISESERILPATRAVVTYSYTSHGEEITKTGVSTQVGPLEIMSVESHRRATNNYARELSLFGLGASFPVLLPFISWVMLSSANDLAFRKRK